MNTRRIVAVAYVGLGLYVLALVGITSHTLVGLLPALVQLALVAALFHVGGSISAFREERAPAQRSEYIGWAPAPSYLLGAAVLVASHTATRYYTGMDASMVIGHLRAGTSLYANYQSYNYELVSAGGGGGFTVWFALLVFKNSLAMCAIFSILGRGGRASFHETILLVCCIAAQMYSGAARGTGLEFFQVGSAVMFALLSRPSHRSSKFRHKLLIFVMCGALAALYIAVLGARGAGTSFLNLGADVRTEESSVSQLIGQNAVSALLTFYSYFGFGFYYVSTYWAELWATDARSFLDGLLPASVSGRGEVRSDMSQLIDVGTRWHPDSVLLAANVGMVGFFCVSLLLGYAGRRLERHASLTSLLLRYFIFLQMLAFPVGNFVWVDTSMLVIAFWLIALQTLRATGLMSPTFGQFFARDRAARSYSLYDRPLPGPARVWSTPRLRSQRHIEDKERRHSRGT